MPETIQRAWDMFISDSKIDSLRAVQKCQEHPGKMWALGNNRMFPLLPFNNFDTPWHSCQYNTLPEIYIQNASLEIAWTKVALERKSISGNAIMPFISNGKEGFDINSSEDILFAEYLISKGELTLPQINQSAYQF
jgi:N-acylneuraminate cytidylyltransferase